MMALEGFSGNRQKVAGVFPENAPEATKMGGMGFSVPPFET